MTRILWSRPGAGGRERLLRGILSAAEKGQKALWLVPEPYSHACERILAETGGAAVCLSASVVTFARLCDNILAAEGGRAAPTLDAGGRLLTLRRAAQKAAPELSELTGMLGRPAFLQNLSDTLDECKCYGITPALLQTAAEAAEGASARRLRDLSLIFGEYDLLCAGSAMDSRDRALLCAEKLSDGGYGKGCALFISHFASFTPQERLLQKTLARRAGSRMVLFEGAPEPALFPVLCKTAALIERDMGGASHEIIHAPGEHRAAGLRKMEAAWFSDDPGAIPNDGSIELWRAAGAAAECRFAAEQINRLVRDDGLRYRDIAVICADEERYGPLAAAIFPHYRIPLFRDRMDTLSGKPLYRLIEAAADCVKYGYRADAVLALLRTGLTGVSAQDADRLENYLRRWNFTGGRFAGKQDWTRSPRGYRTPDERDARALSALNRTRRTIADALAPMTAGQTAVDCARRLCETLGRLGTPAAIERRRDALLTLGEQRQADECAQMWALFCAGAEQCALLLGDERMGMDEYVGLLLLVLSGYSVGAIPASLDRVHCGDMGRFARLPVKAVVLLGASAEALPAGGTPGGLLTLTERSALEAAGCVLPPGPYDRLERELYNIYTVCALPAEKLILTYPLSEKGDDQPADFVRRLAAALGCPVQDIPPPRYPAAEPAAPPSRAPIAPENAVRLYGDERKELRLSASKLEKWSGCRFAYFCRYGLQAEPLPQHGFQPMDEGSFMHKVLQETAQFAVEQGGFKAVPEQAVRDYAVSCAGQMAGRLFRTPEGETARLLAQGRRLIRAADKLASDLWQELQSSDFVPLAFEERLAGTLNPMPGCPGGARGYRLSGFADRVDGFVRDGVTYLRVVDYKTGGKTLTFADLFCGKGLQMPLYLFQLCHAPPPRLGLQNPQPAGVMYAPAGTPVLRTDSAVGRETARLAERKKLRRPGLFLRDPEILHAMDHGLAGKARFLSLQINKDGSPRKGSLVASAAQMDLLRRYIDTKLGAMAEALAGGDVTAQPLLTGGAKSECDWCAYRAACHFDEAREAGVMMRGFDNAASFFAQIGARVGAS